MTPSVTFKFLSVGKCRHLECIAARGGRLQSIDFPSLCGLIYHDKIGWILFDTGYSEHFFSETKHFPESLYQSILPVDLPQEQYLNNQLNQHGITPEDIKLVIISHYHGDHIAGLKNFPNAQFIASKIDTTNIQNLQNHRWQATTQGKLPKLLPDNYFSRLNYAENYQTKELPTWAVPFTHGFDLLSDGSLIAIPLPGHSKGQLGLFLPNANNSRPIFLVADACWSLPACIEGRLPSRLTYFFTADRKNFQKTFFQIQTLALREKEITILPSHCQISWKNFQNESI